MLNNDHGKIHGLLEGSKNGGQGLRPTRACAQNNNGRGAGVITGMRFVNDIAGNGLHNNALIAPNLLYFGS